MVYRLSSLTMDVYAGPLCFQDALKLLLTTSFDFLLELAAKIPDFMAKVPHTFIEGLGNVERELSYRAMLVCWAASAKVPREMKLRVILASFRKKRILVSSGTGSGKTLPMAVMMLMDDPGRQLISFTLSPLKRLQSTQLVEFRDGFNIPTVVINEDTPRDLKWYSVCFRLLCACCSRRLSIVPELAQKGMALESWN